MSCPLFPGMREDFCLRENCRYFDISTKKCTYRKDSSVYRRDRREAERALLKSLESNAKYRKVQILGKIGVGSHKKSRKAAAE